MEKNRKQEFIIQRNYNQLNCFVTTITTSTTTTTCCTILLRRLSSSYYGITRYGVRIVLLCGVNHRELYCRQREAETHIKNELVLVFGKKKLTHRKKKGAPNPLRKYVINKVPVL